MPSESPKQEKAHSEQPRDAQIDVSSGRLAGVEVVKPTPVQLLVRVSSLVEGYRAAHENAGHRKSTAEYDQAQVESVVRSELS